MPAANIKLAARRIAWGKCINAGQTCIAPDYLFVHHSVKDQLVKEFAIAVEEMYGKEIKESRFFPRIVNTKAIERLQKLMQHGKISYGGEVDVTQKFIAPTIIEDVQPDFPIMQEEIFGPLLPVMTFDKLDSVVEFINSNEKPLAFYYFGPVKECPEDFDQNNFRRWLHQRHPDAHCQPSPAFRRCRQQWHGQLPWKVQFSGLQPFPGDRIISYLD